MTYTGKPRIYADFQKLDDLGRTILTCMGTRKDLISLGIELKEGLEVVLYSDDLNENGDPDELEVDGIVEFDADRGRWVARFCEQGFRHSSDAK